MLLGLGTLIAPSVPFDSKGAFPDPKQHYVVGELANFEAIPGSELMVI